jgi:aarF domain-containing kinase
MAGEAPPRSVWSRSTRLVRLAAGLASKELQGRVGRVLDRGEALALKARELKLQVEQARAIVESLGQLKGAAMKAGQLLSMELRDVLPPEVIEVLSRLQAAGATVAFEAIDAVLLEELGPSRRAELEVVPRPLASASIGQVHRATWRPPGGAPEDLALKVQFRGIAESIDSDLALLQRLARLFLGVQRKALDLAPVFAELEEVLKQETDYLHEAQVLERYRALAHRVPGLRVPAVHHALCTRRVLALSHEAGLTLDAWLATGPTAAARDHAAGQVLDLYFREFFDWGLVQTDANFANFLFRPEARELVLLDFGATREYPREFRERYRALLRATLARDRPAALAAAQALGLIDPAEPAACVEALHHLLETVLRVFRPEAQPVDFKDPRIVEESALALRAFYRELTCSPPPAQLLFLHRKLGGVFSLGKALGARLDLLPFAARLEVEAPGPEVPAVA